MKIGVLGSGMVGRSLATALLKAGHEVKIGTRDLAKEDLVKWANEHNAVNSIDTFAATAAFGEILFLCTNWSGTENAIQLASKHNLKGKVLVDVTNPLAPGGPDKAGRLSLDLKGIASGGEQIQNWLPETKVVKALNIIGSPQMDHPYFEEGSPTMFIAGNENAAKQTATHLLHQLGWEDVVDIGEIPMSAHLESLCIVWCAYAFRTGTWNHAFKLLKK
jgi:8-hydroxy-5-deazaflavin:NADPH oxidoreductase